MGLLSIQVILLNFSLPRSAFMIVTHNEIIYVCLYLDTYKITNQNMKHALNFQSLSYIFLIYSVFPTHGQPLKSCFSV